MSPRPRPGFSAAPREGPQQAILLARAGRYVQALDRIEELLADASIAHEARGPAWHLLTSYYGLCLAMVWGQTDRALGFCMQALEQGSMQPDLLHNLGLVQLRARQRQAALESFRHGLNLDPSHEGLLSTLERLRNRRRPLFRFLERKHPLNRLSGRFLTKVRRILDAPQNPLED